MNSETLTAAGRALFGDRWQTDLANALGCSGRTVRRWVAGQSEPGPRMKQQIIALIDLRRRELEGVKAMILGVSP